jgi:hypothetical protein
MTNKAPHTFPGFMVYAKVSADLAEKYGLESGKQTALTLAMARAIRKGELRSYDAGTGLPCEVSSPSVYVLGPEVSNWLQKVGYPYSLADSGSKSSNEQPPGQKKWTDEFYAEFEQKKAELKAAGHKDFAKRAAKFFGVSTGRTRNVKRSRLSNESERKSTAQFPTNQFRSGPKKS